MANQFKLTQKVSKNFLVLLLNNLVMGRLVSTTFRSEFGNRQAQIGDTLTVPRPPSFIVSDGPAFVNQDVVVGSAPVKIDKQQHIGLTWTDLERAISVENVLEDQVLNAKMAALAQQIDTTVMEQVLKFPSWVGTPGETLKNAEQFFEAPKRLDELAVPTSDRNGVLSPADWYKVASFFTGQTAFDNAINRSALEKASLPMLGSVTPFMTQSIINLETGTRTTGTINGAAQNVNYLDVKDTYSQSLVVDGLGAGATIKAGEVFVIDGVFAVNPRTRANLGFLRQFVVLEDAVADGLGNATLTIASPIIVPTGADEMLRTNTAFQTVSGAPADGASLTFVGAAGQSYAQNAVFHKSAIQLVYVEPPRPMSGQFSIATDRQTGISIRVWADSNIISDTHPVRVDVIYGAANVDPRLGTRLSGAA